jgi:F-type H+-transporting ATPase subunit delta
VNPSLQGYAAAVIESVPPGSLDGLASDLQAVDDLVGDNALLRSALTDTAVPATSRRAIIDDLLRDRVSDAARRSASYAAWTASAPDVPAGFAWLSSRARQAAAGGPFAEPTLAHLEARERVAGYAAAVYEELSVPQLDELEDELFRFARTVEGAPALRAALSDRDTPLEARHAVVDQLLSGKVSPAALALVQYTITGGRARDFVGTLDFLVVQTARARGWRVARVRAAREVETDERDRLSEALSSLSGTPVELQVTLDPELVSGVLVDIGDLRVDATARGRLDALREHLLTRTYDIGLRPDDDGSGPPAGGSGSVATNPEQAARTDDEGAS